MPMFRKKPVVVEAMQLTDPNTPEQVAEWCGGRVEQLPRAGGGPSCCIVISTLEGDMRANVNDWIIKGTRGEFYPCKPDCFGDTYEECTDGKPIDDITSYTCSLCGKRHPLGSECTEQVSAYTHESKGYIPHTNEPVHNTIEPDALLLAQLEVIGRRQGWWPKQLQRCRQTWCYETYTEEPTTIEDSHALAIATRAA